MSFRRFFKSSKGFTFIELMVVLAITVIVFGVMIIYGNVGDEQIKIYTDSASVIQSVLRSRSLAITAYWPEGRRVCGYGFHIKNNGKEYEIIRYERKGDPSALCRDIGNEGVDVKDKYHLEVESTNSLNTGNKFDLDQTLPGNEKIPFYILFRPPDPDIYFYNQDGLIFDSADTEVSFVVKSDKGSKMRISVGVGGQVTYAPK